RLAISRAIFSIGDILTANIVAAPLSRGESEVRAGPAANGDRAPWLHRRRSFLLRPKRMNNEENDGDANAGIGDVEGRPGMGEGHVQIEEQKIDYVPVKQAIGEIPKHAPKQQRQGQVAPEVCR